MKGGCSGRVTVPLSLSLSPVLMAHVSRNLIPWGADGGMAPAGRGEEELSSSNDFYQPEIRQLTA